MQISEEYIKSIVEKIVDKAVNISDSSTSKTGKIKVAIGGDHGGFQMKEYLKGVLLANSYEVVDCGTFSKDAVDYPDFAKQVSVKVANGECLFGVMLDGAGIGSSMVMNKVPGCRAALCYNEATIKNSKIHNNANALSLGAPYHTEEELKNLVLLWLKTEFEGGRHIKRVDKIDALDKGKEKCSCSS